MANIYFQFFTKKYFQRTGDLLQQKDERNGKRAQKWHLMACGLSALNGI
jgi:hypothetical protein